RLKFRLQRFTKGDCLGRNSMHVRPTLYARENRSVNECRNVLDGLGRCLEGGINRSPAQNHTPAWAAQRFMRGGRDDMKTIVKRVFSRLAGDQSSQMRHISHQKRPHLIANLSKLVVIQLTRVGAETRQNNLLLMPTGQLT